MPETNVPCVFCDIVAGQNPHHIVYEDAQFMAFLDKYPLNAGHTQFIPKQHFRWVWDMDKADIGFMFMKIRRVVQALEKVMDTEWVIADTGGIGVPHAHVHLVPRFEDDGHGELPDPKILREISEPEMEELARKIRTEIERTPS
ncbi:MAG TPA: HIT family protein [Candidatus Kapabacteria bacterium]|jgi:histidine triad (HIT) family protein|nr:HIT family protein [Candidatus Kapabacteria bacterium]